AKQKLCAVLIDQARVELLNTAADRLIVIADEIDLVAFAACLDAPGGVDLVPPELVAALLTERVDIERAGLRRGKPDGNRVLGKSRRGGAHRGRRHGKWQAKRQAKRNA